MEGVCSVWDNWKDKLIPCYTKKPRCGDKDKIFNGWWMEIKTPFFFHSKASQRRWRNYIRGLFDSNGVWGLQPDQVASNAVEFYQQLLSLGNPQDFDEVLDQIPQVMTTTMNDQLISTFIAAEVELALRQMAPLKSPRPDGMPPLFYQCYWTLVGLDVIEAILGFLNFGMLPKPLCHSLITHIPKVKQLEHISQYRPICLSNVLYRVFSKVLANRLKTLLPHIVSDH